MIDIKFSRPNNVKRGQWCVTAGDRYDDCLSDGEALEVFIAVSRGEKPPYLRTKPEWDAYAENRNKIRLSLETPK